MGIRETLQIRDGTSVCVLHEPGSVDLPLESDEDQADRADCVLAFVRNKHEFEHLFPPVLAAASDDRLAWLAYPEEGEARTDLNRDIIDEIVAKQGAEPTDRVRIDDVWSALRLRPAR